MAEETQLMGAAVTGVMEVIGDKSPIVQDFVRLEEARRVASDAQRFSS